MKAEDIKEIVGEDLAPEKIEALSKAIQNNVSEESHKHATNILEGVVKEIEPVLGEQRNQGEKTSDYIKRVIPSKIEGATSEAQSKLKEYENKIDELTKSKSTDEEMKSKLEKLSKEHEKALKTIDSLNTEKQTIEQKHKDYQLKTSFQSLLPEINPEMSKSTVNVAIDSAFTILKREYEDVYINDKGELMAKKDFKETAVKDIIPNIDFIKDIAKKADAAPSNPNNGAGGGADPKGGEANSFKAISLKDKIESKPNSINYISELQSAAKTHLESIGIDKNHPDFLKNFQELVKENTPS